MAWVAQADSSVALEPAIARYATALATVDPQSALVQVGRISNAQRRTKSLISVAHVWYQADPGPATAWLEQSELDDEQRAEVVAPTKVRKRDREKKDGAVRNTNKRNLSGLRRGR